MFGDLALSGRTQQLDAGTLCQHLALPPGIGYKPGGGASRIHGTSRQLSSTGEKSS